MDVTLSNPCHRSDGQPYVWLRGNLHAHSTRSDGKRSPQDVIDAYAKLGHHFFQLSDHDVLSDYSGLDARGMVLLRGNEVSRGGCHIQHIGATVRVEPSPERQKVIDDIADDGGLAVINHPNWTMSYDHCPLEKMLEWKNYHGVEIYNGGCARAEGSAFALEKWDRLLSTGRLAWGFANDDSHSAAEDGMGWNVALVPANRQTPEGVFEALRNGSFYASSGVVIEHIQTEGARLQIVAPNAQAIEIIGASGIQLAFVEGCELSFDAGHVTGAYVRAQCYGAAGRMAWTQPFLIRGGPAERMIKLLAEKPVLKALRADVTPPLTGRADGLWPQARAATTFYRAPDAGAPEVATSVRCILSPKHLTFLARCDEPQTDKLKTTFGDNDTNLWADDSLEIFLDTEAGGKTYYQLLVNAAGKFCGGHNARTAQIKQQSCVLIEKDAWTLQIALDLESLGLTAPPQAGARWGLQICRNRLTNPGRFRFTWCGASNHNPSAYGWLEF
jgi:hypothetical protein